MSELLQPPPKDFKFLLNWVDRADVEETRREMKSRKGFIMSKRQVNNIINGRQTNWKFISRLAARALENFKLISATKSLN